jgi:dTDP-4-dehydrorhamnose reductase
VSAAESPKIFITGKNGQVGRELVERATELGLEAISFGSEELDIRDRKAVIAAIDEHQPTVVINAAAYTAVDKAETEVDLAYAVNRDGVENLALACKAQNIPLIHISTDYVFDGEKESPYVESDVPNPVGVYGASKYAGEEVLRATWEKHIIVRVKTMLRLGQERDALSVVSDQFGAPTSARFIAKEILNCTLNQWGTYHLVSNHTVSWFDFASRIFQYGFDLGLISRRPNLKPLTTEEYPTAAERPSNSKLNTMFDSKFAVSLWVDELEDVLQAMLERK